MANEFNGYNFDELKDRKRMKYVVISDGDLDLNNAYGFSSKKALDKYIKDENYKTILAVFKVEDVTP